MVTSDRIRSDAGMQGGPGCRVLDFAVIHAAQGRVTIGQDVLVMEHAVLRGRADHPLTIGDAVLIGPHTHLNGAVVEDEVFIATGASLFPGSRAGAELRINSVLHVNSRLAPGSVVPIGWVAAGDPAELFSPDRHQELWAVVYTPPSSCILLLSMVKRAPARRTGQGPFDLHLLL